MQMIEVTQKIKAILHPDALYDDIYEQTELDISSYYPFTTNLTLRSEANGVTVASTKGCVRIDPWEEGIIRLRIDPVNVPPASSPTENLGLLESRPATPAFNCRQEGATLPPGARMSIRGEKA